MEKYRLESDEDSHFLVALIETSTKYFEASAGVSRLTPKVPEKLK